MTTAPAKSTAPGVRLALGATAIASLLLAIFAAAVTLFQAELRKEVHQTIVDRYAAVLYPMAEAQLREAESDPTNGPFAPDMLLSSVLKQQEGMLAVVIYDGEGNTLQALPTSLLLAELSPTDYPRLLSGEHITRYTPNFPLDRYFAGIGGAPDTRLMPVLEVVLPLHGGDHRSTPIAGFVQYYIDARRLAQELAAIDSRMNRQTAETLGIGATLIAIVLIAAYRGLARAQRMIAERNERLTRANFELTLAAKTSALGVITSHLIHGLQGPVAGLRAVVGERAADGTRGITDWESAANYTERMQAMIHETVALLGDTSTQTSYELSGAELAATIRERNQAAAIAKGVILEVADGFAAMLDSQRGSLLCLIATNLVQNAIEATDPGRHVTVGLEIDDQNVVLTVRDQGPGMPDSVRAHLFEPGRTGRPGGTGLGLAISQLIARQIGATLELAHSGPTGTAFRVVLPLAPT